MKLEQPLLTLSAIEFLEKHLNNEITMLEYGSGYSTLWFAQRVKKIISIENNGNWYRLISNKVITDNVDHRLLSTDKYVDVYKDLKKESFDFILVDGARRETCAFNSHQLIKPGGILMLDDAQKKHYSKNIGKFLEGQNWEKHITVERCLMHSKTARKIRVLNKQTNWWIKPNVTNLVL